MVSGWPVFARSGALFTYGPHLDSSYRRLAYYADRIIELVRAAKLVPELIKRIDQYYPPFGAAPPPPPLPEIAVIEHRHWLGYGVIAVLAAAAGAATVLLIV